MAVIISIISGACAKNFSLPRALDEPPLTGGGFERVTTIPHLLNLEIGWRCCGLALLIAWSTWIPAPLEDAANPTHRPTRPRPPGTSLGFQELLLHFHPAFVTS